VSGPCAAWGGSRRNLSAASSSIDQKLAERGLQLTGFFARSRAADQVERAQNKVQEHMPILLERLGQEQAARPSH
jgi:hypothetical protein